jgi:hypothetical protein
VENSAARGLFESVGFKPAAQLVDLTRISGSVGGSSGELATRLPFSEIVTQGYLSDSALELESRCGWNIHRETLLRQRARLWITVITTDEALRAYCISRNNDESNEEELLRFQGVENSEGAPFLAHLVNAIAATSTRTLAVPGIPSGSPLCESLQLVGFEIKRRFTRYEAAAKEN